MGNSYSPMLDAGVTQGRIAAQNGRGVRGLSQVGLVLNAVDEPVAAIAAFVESVPVELFNGVPGRARARECFREMGQVLDEHFFRVTAENVLAHQIVEPEFWQQEFGDLVYAIENGPAVHADLAFPFAGVGKLFFASTVVELAKTIPGLWCDVLDVTPEHRHRANTGSLRHLTGPLQLSVDDAMQLIIGSGDGAAVLAIIDSLHSRGIDVLETGRRLVAELDNTTISGLEQHSSGEGFTGTTTANDLLTLLRHIVDDNGRLEGWMASVFEPAGLASELPGYGRYTIKHWTIADWARLEGLHLEQGRSSGMILSHQHGRVAFAVHAPVGTRDVPVKFGSLGLSATTRC